MVQRVVTILVIVFIVLGGGYYAYQQLVPPPEEETKGPVYATEPVVRGDITVGVEVTGTLRPSSGGTLRAPGYGQHISGGFEFIIDEILVEEGEDVRKGEVVARLKSTELENKIETMEEQVEKEREYLAELMNVPMERIYSIDPSAGITLQAPIEGRVVDLRVEEGEELLVGDIVAKIVDDSRYRLIAKLTKSEFQHAKKGQKAYLRFKNFDGLVEGKVVDVNPNPVSEPISELMDSWISGGSEEQYQFVYWVTIEAENPGLVRPGMKVNVGLVRDASGGSGYESQDVMWLRYHTKVKEYVNEEKVLSKVEAIATEVHVQNMERVKKGAPIVSLVGEDAQEKVEEKLEEIRKLEEELNNLRSLLDEMEVKSPMDGVVAHINSEIGQTFRPGQWMGHIYNTADMRMLTQVDDMDVLLVRQGAPVTITLDALPGKEFKGKVEHVSTMGEDEQGMPRFRVEISVIGGPELRPGMQAKGYIDAGSAEDVLLVPVEAIFEEDGKPAVEILQPDGTVKLVNIKLGLMNDRVAEVKSGLEEGQQVIVGSSADVLPSQKIQSNDTLLPDSGGDDENGGGQDESGDSNE